MGGKGNKHQSMCSYQKRKLLVIYGFWRYFRVFSGEDLIWLETLTGLQDTKAQNPTHFLFKKTNRAIINDIKQRPAAT